MTITIGDTEYRSTSGTLRRLSPRRFRRGHSILRWKYHQERR